MQQIIEVTSIKLPLDFSEKRELRYNINHVNGSILDPGDIEQYDNDTVVYDVFFDIMNRSLYTVGPPFLNLQRILFPITCRINNGKRKHLLQVEEYFDRNIAIGRISLQNLSLYDENVIEFDFNNRFQWNDIIKLNRFQIKPIILTTIQRDNRIQWIKEWIEFYSYNYNIDQVIIYDNNSSNRDDLKSIVDARLTIIEWDFKYGPTRSHANQFCQLGSLNHCRLKFGANNIIMNFDIDELLYLKKPGLQKYINRYNLMLFDGYRVPFIKPISEDYSYADFLFRDSEPQQGGRKYFYNSSNVIANNIHTALLKRHGISLYRRLETIYYKLSRTHKISRLYSYLLRFISIILKLKIVPVNEAYFLHYTGITNNWKSRYWNRKEETALLDKHIKFNITEL
jgi:hypothetical protein